VRHRRQLLGIPCFQSRLHPWRPEDDRILGTRPDDQIAALLRRSTKAVTQRRREKHIPMFHGR
jgi:hypothetical protein